MTDLPDVNLWVALVDQRHVHHPLAKAYWDQSGARVIVFCRITMLGFLRITTNPKAVVNPKTNDESWNLYRKFMDFPNIQFLAEPAGLEPYFHALTTQAPLPPRLWTDAYLAAFSIASGSRLITFDTDFSRFPGLNYLRLSQ